MAAQAIATSAELTALSGQMAHASKRINDVSQRMDDMSQRVSTLETDFHGLAENFVRSTQLSRTTETQLGRVARLLGAFAGRSNTRFEEIEGRLVKLERKVG